MNDYAAAFVQSYVNALNDDLRRLVTDETREVTKIILGKAFESYRRFSDPNARIYGHADGEAPFFNANHPALEMATAEYQSYDLFLQGGAFPLLLESELNVRRAAISADYAKLFYEQFAGYRPLRVIVIRNNRQDREWRDNRFVSPFIDSWRTNQDFAIVEICWPSTAIINQKYARARLYRNGINILSTEDGDWRFSLSVTVDPIYLELPGGYTATVTRTIKPEYPWKN